MGSMFTFEMSIRKNHELVTSGPYAIVRHPGYTSVMLVVIGMLLVHLSKVSIPLVGILAVETESVPSGLLVARVWYTQDNGNGDNHGSCLHTGCNHHIWAI